MCEWYNYNSSLLRDTPTPTHQRLHHTVACVNTRPDRSRLGPVGTGSMQGSHHCKCARILFHLFRTWLDACQRVCGGSCMCDGTPEPLHTTWPSRGRHAAAAVQGGPTVPLPPTSPSLRSAYIPLKARLQFMPYFSPQALLLRHQQHSKYLRMSAISAPAVAGVVAATSAVALSGVCLTSR